MVEDDEIEAVMNRVADPQRCASALVNEAIAAGGLDNVTVIVADAEGAAKVKRRRIAVRTWITVLFVLLLLVGIIAGAAWGGYTYLHSTAYLAQNDKGMVAVYRGVPGDVLGFSYSELVQDTDVPVADLAPSASERIAQGMRVSSVDEAIALVDSYREELAQQKASAASASASAASSEASPSDSSEPAGSTSTGGVASAR
jgi:protein phosphatase